MQNPVQTEHNATKRAWGVLLSPAPPFGRPKKRATSGTFGTTTSLPSPATTRLPFHRISAPKRSSYRDPRRRHKVLKNARLSCLRAWQKASSDTGRAWRSPQSWRTTPHAWSRPWVMDSVYRATYIISQATTSGTSGRSRLGAQPVCSATIRNSCDGMIVRNGQSPKRWRIAVAPRDAEPILDMRKPPCQSRTDGGHPMTTSSAFHPSACGGFFH
jgi:hypothetical protein